jgi:hypothetical protein
VAPTVKSTFPSGGATGVRCSTNLTAAFSKPMDPATITSSTFRLLKVNADGSTTRITNAPVTLSSDGLQATLDPFGTSTTLLAKSTKSTFGEQEFSEVWVFVFACRYSNVRV